MIRSVFLLPMVGVATVCGYFYEELATFIPESAFSSAELVGSSVDGVCKKLWVKRARNDPALACYLKTSPSRLCKPFEKDHLLAVIARYDRDRAAFESALAGYLFRVQLNFGSLASSEKDFDRAYKKTTQDAAQPLLDDPDFAKAVKLQSLPDLVLTTMLRKLTEQGLVTKADLGWWPPSWQAEVFADAIKVKPICPSISSLMQG